MKAKTLLAGAVLALSGSAAFADIVSCGAGTTAMSEGSVELFQRAFSSAQSFSDCYSFSISDGVTASGGTLTIDPLSWLDIVVTSITLSGGNLAAALVDTTPGMFSFGNLGAGTYQLVVSGEVVRGSDFDDILPLPVAYAGSLTTTTAALPEPATAALVALALGITGALTRRRVR